ncbi:MAG: 2-oxoacid:ferredoxin oxidoreductase subunit beta [Rhodospirillaceae bacterium]|jgi:2-oxoglutarate/2-oxoacid ferredoxin oxidoreductase subunit beta|nr:2-oxoacid:ferredoxin oxidoreductase subunit beta [Rhodospirillaceae bacterium]MBT4044488.1 2-oxoacid:ferredoxin oxidoreductase subunit beta [Rhodospirillaceae bacterium]MBT4686732.1 2-oxoacid:ferredoxin oxidoreductase subunit beta [Rhodospirillaceae bacterium]MBT5082481.1 2-oxoacid:ferredoxin oxidoreductase subunit beta [Rhodospirillaceae bacterium]MBT5523982.1 2-oxoacid:ferredoxin oxidoreductase subunit beta [Rhodospirillaceae bacterium]
MNAPAAPLKAKDFASDQEVRWCPGCGDYAILKGVQKTLADIGTPPENVVFISGIGCSSRFPYYMSTYGFHTIHGRAPAFATGVKLANPELDVWLVTGDGDGLSIGGNHLLHALRRNVNMQIMLFNNEIYGLTKGQYSPTSKIGTRSPSTPMGSLDRPLSPVLFALGANASFVARAVDTQQKHMPGVLQRAHAHQGASFVEIYTNCIVYNDGAFSSFAEKGTAAEGELLLEHGEPMIFGKDSDKGIRMKPGALELEVVQLGVDGIGEDDLLLHDETNRVLAGLLGAMQNPDFPVAVGVLYCEAAEAYESAVYQQVDAARAANGNADFNALLRSGSTWTVGD